MTPDIRVGHGWDVHAFGNDRPLRLGGVEIPGARGLAGHSDADVLAHAVASALLGSLALGDLGTHFPDTDPRFRDARSLDLLSQVAEMVRRRGYRVGNCDCTVIAESPRLAPHIDAMRQRLAGALGVEMEQVSVKATTAERLGALGRGEGIAAHSVVLVVRDE
jgi:2-C-methyl-D-erythritol 2,4-cyclodiphosphate synthase